MIRSSTTRRPVGRIGWAVGLAALLLVVPACAGESQLTADEIESDGAPTPTAPTTPTSTTLTMTPAQARTDTGELLGSDCYARRQQSAPPDPEDCSFGFFDGDTVVLYGDSHAAQWFGAAVEMAERHDWRLLPVTKADCPPGGEPVLSADNTGEYAECTAWHTAAMALIESQEPILVLATARSDHYRVLGDDGEPLSSTESADRLAQALTEDLRAFADMGARTVLIRDTPGPGFDVPDCIEAEGAEACSYQLAETSPEDSAQRAAARASGTAIVDLRQEVCGGRVACVSVIDGLITFRDAEHLTGTFGASLADELEAGIQAVPA